MNSKWIREQFENVNMSDARLQKRAVKIAQGCAERPEKSLSGCFDELSRAKSGISFFCQSKSYASDSSTAPLSRGIRKSSFLRRARSVHTGWLRAFIQFSSMDTWT